MKKNDWLLIISVMLYSILFYKQTAGLNFFIFNIVIISALAWREPVLLKNKVWLSVAAGAIISSFFIFMYGSALSIWANIISLLILSPLSIDPRTSFITGIFLSACSTGSSCAFMFIDWAKRKRNSIEGEYHRPFYVKFFLIIIPLLIAVVFFFFYQTANPLFYDFTKNINLDFISIGWIFFTYSGLLLMYGFYHSLRIKGISDTDVNASLSLTPESAARKNMLNGLMRLDTEMLSGIILFSMLNLLLLLLNILDLNYLWFDGTLPEGIKHKEFVHNGIGTLITSIIVAILILLFYFRGELNFEKKNKWLRLMAGIWIIQNVFMIFSTAFRNSMYIEESGLSYKKIGVYVYLLLALIGLITTFIKVKKIKTNWYLFRVNSAVYYYILVISCIFNWDVIITDFNIKKHTEEKKELEKYLLLDLSYKNLPQLLALPDSIALKDDYKARDYYHSLRGVYFYDFKSGLDKKLYDFLEEYFKMEWQSTCIEKTRVYNELAAEKDSIRSLKYDNAYLTSLQPLKMFDNLRSLNLNNAELKDVSELKWFPKLVRLQLNNNKLDTIRGFPPLANLQELDLSNNSISNIYPLRGLINLEVLDISGGNRIKSFAPLLQMKKLKHLTLGEITPEGLASLQKLFPGVVIKANVINISNSGR